jgi:urease accessory protein
MLTAMTIMDMVTSPAALPLLRLLQLVSPSLPVGAFAYSQGLEWAVEAEWIGDADEVERWLDDQLQQAIARVDLPLLLRMQAAADGQDRPAMSAWIDQLLAMRETAELRAEEINRGRALAGLLGTLGLLDPAPAGQGADAAWQPLLARSQLAAFGYAAAAWRIDPGDALAGYAWAWLENLTLAAVKIVPLGQSQGQRLLARLAATIPAAVDAACGLGDDDIGAASPALAIASGCHETQYTRLYRS